MKNERRDPDRLRKRVDLTKDQAQRILHDIREKKNKPEDDEVPMAPFDYRRRVGQAAEKALRAKNMTRGVNIAVKKDEAIVAIICTRQHSKPWVQQADCQVAFEEGIEPEQLGRIMVEELEENLEKVKRGIEP